MNSHLTDDQFASWIVGQRDPAAASHIAECAECRLELQHNTAALVGFAEYTRRAAERDQFFWTRQRAAVRARLRTAVPVLRWAGATIAATVIAGALLLSSGKPPHVTVATTNDAADEALLLEIQNDVGRDTPSALQPAQELASERSAWLASLDGSRH
jgi:hypothetical protein